MVSMNYIYGINDGCHVAHLENDFQKISLLCLHPSSTKVKLAELHLNDLR